MRKLYFLLTGCKPVHQLKPNPVETTCRCEFIRTDESRMLLVVIVCACGCTYASVRMNSHQQLKPMDQSYQL